MTLENEGNTVLTSIRNHSNNALSHPTRLEPLITILQKPHDSHTQQSAFFLISMYSSISHLPHTMDLLQCNANSVDPLQCIANSVDLLQCTANSVDPLQHSAILWTPYNELLIFSTQSSPVNVSQLQKFTFLIFLQKLSHLIYPKSVINHHSLLHSQLCQRQKSSVGYITAAVQPMNHPQCHGFCYSLSTNGSVSVECCHKVSSSSSVFKTVLQQMTRCDIMGINVLCDASPHAENTSQTNAESVHMPTTTLDLHILGSPITLLH